MEEYTKEDSSSSEEYQKICDSEEYKRIMELEKYGSTNVYSDGNDRRLTPEEIEKIENSKRKSRREEKSWGVTFLLCLFAGCFGLHRFYAGRYITGLIWLMTFGGMGLLVISDLFLILSEEFEDGNGFDIERKRDF